MPAFAQAGICTRRALVRRLSQGPAVISELAEPFDMTFAAVSKHLKVLESANLVRREVDGRFRSCRLDPAPMEQAERWIHDYSAFWTGMLDCLAERAQEVSVSSPKVVFRPWAEPTRDQPSKPAKEQD